MNKLLLDYLNTNYEEYERVFVPYKLFQSRIRQSYLLDVIICGDFGRWSRVDMIMSSNILTCRLDAEEVFQCYCNSIRQISDVRDQRKGVKHFEVRVEEDLGYYGREIFLLAEQEVLFFISISKEEKKVYIMENNGGQDWRMRIIKDVFLARYKDRFVINEGFIGNQLDAGFKSINAEIIVTEDILEKIRCRSSNNHSVLCMFDEVFIIYDFSLHQVVKNNVFSVWKIYVTIKLDDDIEKRIKALLAENPMIIAFDHNNDRGSVTLVEGV